MPSYHLTGLAVFRSFVWGIAFTYRLRQFIIRIVAELQRHCLVHHLVFWYLVMPVCYIATHGLLRHFVLQHLVMVHVVV